MHATPRLLIIDDDEQLVTMLAELLRLEHYVVDTAADGRSGLRALDEGTPDLVVLDVMMPGMDGFETLAAIRARSAVPVLMLTARGDIDDRITGLEAGADDYLPKPFNPDTLPLTGAELRVLEGLLREAGHVASRDALTQFALGRKRTAYDRALDTHISNLRQKLGGDDAPVEIRNMRGAGYALLPRDGTT